MITAKYIIKKKRNVRLRKALKNKVRGTSGKPRMIIVKSNKYLYTQVIDDESHVVLASASTLEKAIRENVKSSKNIEAAKKMGELIAERLKKIKIGQILFDRNVYLYTGRVKAFADAAREKGIQF